MNAKTIGLMATAAMLAVAAPAAAQSETPRWSVSFDLGPDMALSGDVHGSGAGTVLGLPTQVGARSYGDIYGPGFQWSAALGYAVGREGEVRGRFSWTALTAERIQVGTVAGLPLFGLFDDMTEMGADFGYRQYFTPADARVRPFAGGQVGFVMVDSVRAEFTVPDAGVTIPAVDFYDSSTVATFGFSGGVYIRVSPNFGVQGGVDLRWRDALTPKDGLAGTGLESINDDSSRWSLPIFFGATVRFGS